ncbi:alpha/beta hydrolase fold domain-containing protein [Zobellia uliginosa]|uniref:alpha/beta hydrolase fold domain-containing protein n=1 Tax=Zobellia uliginosa TaxID=143224 RepID=UPI0026E30608|nr:alpha/beta hydrolase fold domain-containing protein [Zobellia uliginosa]MDO6517402.1 alpha/beta hydrolase fold domain-containing protein [Zobellia uliginosa]
MKAFFLSLFLIHTTMVFPVQNTSVKDGIVPDEIVAYKTMESTKLSLHVFNPKGHKATDNAPVIVFFFGGGWSGGTPKQFYQQSRYFAEKGMVAISAEYRVNRTHGTTPFDAVTDAKSAIRWVRKHAKELGVDPNKIIASGGSAGGHIAACTGIIEAYDAVDEDLTISSIPNAMVLYNPVLDTTEKGYGMAKVGEERKTDISPNHRIKPNIVPTIVFHGTADKTVPFENAQRFELFMKSAGNDCVLVPYEGKDHGFFNGSFFRGKRADEMVYADLMERTYAFIEARVLTSKEVKPARIFGNHMVLQQQMDVPVWGRANAGQEVTVAFAGQEKNTIADENGRWEIILEPMEAYGEGRDLVISAENKKVISDVLVGEVWICSGQSNMQMSVDAAPDIEALVAKAKNIRSFEVGRTVALDEAEDVIGTWSDEVPKSAVAFSFAYFLEKAGDVPIGIIQSSWGSSSLEAWMPKDMTGQLGYFDAIMKDFDADTLSQNRIKSIIENSSDRSNEDDVFLRRQPNVLYNAMMKPLAPYAVKGLVWYQGERNTRYISGVPQVNKDNWFHRVIGMKEYGDVLKAWISRYRKQWDNEDMYFMVVMLPGYGKGTVENPKIDPNDPTAQSWAWMRESQLKALELPKVSVINTIDLGDVKNIHPKDKLPIGRRLALEAAKKTLGKEVVTEGPIVERVERQKRSLVVHYTNADMLKTADGKPPKGFWIADESLEWKPAKAKIKGRTVVLRSKEIKAPNYIRYAFSGKPDVNLVNGADLPAYPFRTDTGE